MSEGFDVLKAMRGIGGDRRVAWEFVGSFTAAFAAPIVDGDGVEELDLCAAEARLGVVLPAALREAYLLFGRRVDLTCVQDRLLAPDRLHIDDRGEAVVFRVENQHCATWGVPIGALGQDDPPVVVEVGAGWVPYSERMSLACVEMVLSESTLSSETNADNRELDDDALAAIERGFDRLPLPDFPFWAELDGPPIRWFSGSDAVLRDDGGAWLWVKGRSPAAMNAVRARLPGEWLMTPDDE